MKPITVLNKGNVPTGPFTRAEVEAKLRSGEISDNDLAFVEGLAQWTRLREVLAMVDVDSPPPPVAAPVNPPSVSAPPAYSYAATMAPPTHLVYGGFWIRFVAYLIDGFIIGAVVFVVAFLIAFCFMILGSLMGVGVTQMVVTSGDQSRTINMGGSNNNPMSIVLILIMELGIWGTALVASWLYFAKMESGPAQATLGKRALGLRVTDLTGQRISFGRASGRFFGKIVSALPMDIGFIMAAFTERKQALHDMIAGTLVIRS